jgi:phage terminase large subunit GpA-like protein
VSKTKATLKELLETYFHRREIVPIDRWVEENIRLSSRQSTHTGRYSLKRTPFFRQIYLDLANPEVRQITLSKAAQIGFSQLASNAIMYYICNKTLPVAWILPSQGMAQQASERTLHPAIQSTKAIQEYLTGSQDDIRRSELIFKNGVVVKVVGGGSATKLSSNPIAFLILDEASKLEEAFTSEAGAIELAIDRTLSFVETGEAKILVASTPQTEHSCAVTKHFLEGDQNYYYVPCPHCNHKQVLTFANIKFDHCKEGDTWNLNRVLKESFYCCVNCHGEIHDQDKVEMLNKGEWRPHNKDAPSDLKSYQISALYSLSLTFGGIARMFLSAKGDRSRLQNFKNSIEGIAWVPTAATVSIENIDKIIEKSPKYVKGEIPGKVKALILSADTQQSELYFMVSALLENNAVAVVDYGIVISWEDLANVLNAQYKVKGTEEYVGIYAGIIDAGGNRTGQVYDFCLSLAGRIVPSFGRGDAHKQFVPIRHSTIVYKGINLPIMNVHDKHFTDLLLLSCFKYGQETLYLPKDTENILKEQLTAVSIVEKKDKAGFLKYEYQSKTNNHYFDCLKLSQALIYYLKPTLNEPVEQEPKEEEEEKPVPEPNLWN